MMSKAMEDLRILQAAETISDDVWNVTLRWEPYPKNVMGRQLCRAVDSIGANIAEAFGRYHYGEKIRFLYYARGSLFETKYWLNRAHARRLISADQAADYSRRLNDLGRQLNSFVNHIKRQQRTSDHATNTIGETAPDYQIEVVQSDAEFLNEEEQQWLSDRPPPQSPIANP